MIKNIQYIHKKYKQRNPPSQRSERPNLPAKRYSVISEYTVDDKWQSYGSHHDNG